MTDEHIPPAPACARIDNLSCIELAFQETSRKAVDELLTHLVTILANPPEHDTVRIFISSKYSKKPQPIMYLMQQLRANRTRLASERPLRVAVTFNFPPLAHMVNMFVTVLDTPRLRFKSYAVGQEEVALEWLLGE